MKISELNLKAMASAAGVTPEELWDVLAGGTAASLEIAEAISVEAGISARTLCFETAARIRPGVLDWIAHHVGTSKNHAWRIMNGLCLPSPKMAHRLEAFSGIPARAWVKGESWMVAGQREVEEV
jgi:transcriptional regulator with XRE-family HTH domain